MNSLLEPQRVDPPSPPSDDISVGVAERCDGNCGRPTHKGGNFCCSSCFRTHGEHHELHCDEVWFLMSLVADP